MAYKYFMKVRTSNGAEWFELPVSTLFDAQKLVDSLTRDQNDHYGVIGIQQFPLAIKAISKKNDAGRWVYLSIWDT